MTTLSTLTTERDPEHQRPPRRERRAGRRNLALLAAALVASGLGAGIAVAVSGSSSQPPVRLGSSAVSAYQYYESVMGRYGGGSMMGGPYGSMMGSSGYRWMMGGNGAPGWMDGGNLPGAMMGSGNDPGKVMGTLWANSPGPRVSQTDATRLGNEVPPGATLNAPANTVSFSAATVHLVVLASPAGGPDMTFRSAGLVNPTIEVRADARVSIELINADSDTAHGLAVTSAGSASSSWMPMMTAAPAFPSSALWFLGDPTSAGLHAGTITFTAASPGTFQYLCPVPGHAQKGMVGMFVVIR